MKNKTFIRYAEHFLLLVIFIRIIRSIITYTRYGNVDFGNFLQSLALLSIIALVGASVQTRFVYCHKHQSN